jgi:hypothetical protein
MSQKPECTVYVAYDASVWLRPWKGQYFLAAAMVGLGTDVRKKEFSPQSLLNSQTFAFLSLKNRVE